jgi:hypothetical protein
LTRYAWPTESSRAGIYTRLLSAYNFKSLACYDPEIPPSPTGSWARRPQEPQRNQRGQANAQSTPKHKQRISDLPRPPWIGRQHKSHPTPERQVPTPLQNTSRLGPWLVCVVKHRAASSGSRQIRLHALLKTCCSSAAVPSSKCATLGSACMSRISQVP